VSAVLHFLAFRNYEEHIRELGVSYWLVSTRVLPHQYCGILLFVLILWLFSLVLKGVSSPDIFTWTSLSQHYLFWTCFHLTRQLDIARVYSRTHNDDRRKPRNDNQHDTTVSIQYLQVIPWNKLFPIRQIAICVVFTNFFICTRQLFYWIILLRHITSRL